jgi:hypothetical protein
MRDKALTLATVGLPTRESNYYLSVFALTPKQESTQTGSIETPQNTPFVSSLILWTPFVLFFLLFIVSFGLLILNKVWNWKRTVGAMILAFCLAGIPFVVSAIKQGVVRQYQAGPSEYPRHVKIMPKLPDSVIVAWDTDIPAVGAIRLGPSPINNLSAKVVIADNGQKTVKHTVIADGIKSGTVVELEIFSGSGWYDNGGAPLRFKAVFR